MTTYMKTIDLIRSDMTAIGARTDRLHILLYLLFYFTRRAVILVRLANSHTPIAGLCRSLLKKLYLFELGCPQIGPYLRLPHPKGITLAATSIGSNCLFGQWITLGGNNCKERLIPGGGKIHVPTIGNNVQVYAGSVVAGPIIVGNDVIIGANTTVTSDVPAHTLIYNRPAVSTKKVRVPGFRGAFEKYE